MKKEVIIKANHVIKYFKVGHKFIQILKGIDVSIFKGEFIILFGSSGCGKSTLLNTLLGLEVPTEGTVNFLGKNIYTFDEDGRSQIRKEGMGLISQQQNWIKSLNVIENVAFPLTLRGFLRAEREEKALKFLEMVKMQEAAYQAPTELSSGEQQKVSFARALISNPEVLIADEPTGNLDSKSSIELMNLFKSYNDEGHTIIMVTHDLKFLSYATRSINLSDGQIVGEYDKGDQKLEQFKVFDKKYADA
jgi:putative ABC transport system ATP-binding protein